MNPTPKTVLIPLPNLDFDPSEVAVSWRILTSRGHHVVFATPDGKAAAADPLMLSGEGLDAWGWIPLLRKIRLLGLALRANAAARADYAVLADDGAFQAPLPYAALQAADYDGLLLPGGHRARGMLAYLESQPLQDFTGAFFDSGKPVAAICHGVVLAARSRSPRSGKSALHGRKTTALTWQLEHSAWTLMKFCGRFWDPAYYRTYGEQEGEAAGYRGVQAEVTRALAQPGDFIDVTAGAPDHFRKSSGLFRDSAGDSRPAFVVQDDNYVSARWPGDVHHFAATFSLLLEDRLPRQQPR
ncbi:type 1 glutamine amidotransferase domain-containing protein [Collimonas sp. OK412]|jgi:putative intracellular protease/amidase|uniref:type 1 glutamine amidotransferase domain-containing protein n=1 Tax=Collimonas sp. (strain OK412) TaxID=1801619 RepID=UPI0008EE1AC8|nr:type 1 glutamine amidotransferase domain-containing protein [Collimonas sp. OK412]SFD04361.1 ThiJ/PfpI family-like [Collimonas sp. OK412]